MWLRFYRKSAANNMKLSPSRHLFFTDATTIHRRVPPSPAEAPCRGWLPITLGTVETAPSLAQPLGSIHRLVRLGDEVLGIGGVGRIEGDTDACANLYTVSLE
jgi:hypothetical protein